jgi:hypothetical protein
MIGLKAHSGLAVGATATRHIADVEQFSTMNSRQ